eukprot:CAMPEP_0198282006 /NCGR_PEP_ID=MMETSP1449-20131203/1886_1 /TAXON_ID=420275 /ORGANISM="Attheya septentrionalis, Strain CCMP2084" /LENGTH=277 /DNA_ID=CAMNT_0043978073 /DNA_START=183 /DNA_END=1016 /DNA_ORIENTATION=-
MTSAVLNHRRSQLSLVVGVLLLATSTLGFSPSLRQNHAFVSKTSLGAAAPLRDGTAAPPATGFIDTELRGAAMKLHTRRQAPKEGQAEEQKPAAAAAAAPYVTTLDDYLKFLVDSQHVYQALEDVVNDTPELACFRNTGLERTEPLEKDILFLTQEYKLTRPAVGQRGLDYAEQIRDMGSRIPEFMCHYYNFYFAHTAGGRMIGKKMSSLLLNKLTLEFYKWDGDLNDIKGRVRENIETIADSWTREEKDLCVSGTVGAFKGGGGLNSYLSGGGAGH